MKQALIERIVADEQAVPHQADDPFTYSYFEFIRYFQNLAQIEGHHVVIGANFTYGWMPTMLRLKHTNFEHAVETLNRAKAGQRIENDDLGALAALINNSLVGSSKLLHFVNPHLYAIWDSRVYRYLFGNTSQYHLHTPRIYQTYLNTCHELTTHSAFPHVHTSINVKMGRDVTALRAVEVIMYTGGVPQAVSTLQNTSTVDR